MKKSITLIIVFSFVFLLCACEKSEKKDEKNETIVFEYGDAKVSKGEVYIYVKTIKERYEMQYGVEVWDMILPDMEEEMTMEDMTRQEVIEEIVKVKTLVKKANEYDVRLSETEEAQITADAENFYELLTDDNINQMELNFDIVHHVMEENLIAGKVEEAILFEEPIEISDEEARRTRFFDMFFPCYKKDAAGNIVEYSDEEKEIQYKNALNACSTLGTAVLDENEVGEDIEKLSEYFRLTEAGERIMSPEEIQETYGAEVTAYLYEMKDGEYSSVITTEYGYHVFEMIELTDQKATAEQKEIMTEEAKSQFLQKKIENWKKSIDDDFSFPDSVNMELYDSIKIK